MFRSNITRQSIIDKSAFKKVIFTSLSQLIELVRKNDDTHFDDKFVIYFIEPSGKKYIQQKVFFMGGHVTTTQ